MKQPSAGHLDDPDTGPHARALLAARVVGNERAVVLGDAIHCPLQITHPEWEFSSDVNPEAAKQVRERLVRELDAPHTTVVGPHFPEAVFGRVLRGHGAAPGRVRRRRTRHPANAGAGSARGRGAPPRAYGLTMAVRAILGVILLAIGGVWIAQGTGALGGSFMSGEAIWAIIGFLVAAVGLGLLLGVARSRRIARDSDD